MPRQLDSKAKTPDLHIKPANPQEEKVCREAKSIAEHDKVTLKEYILPLVEKENRRRRPGNPQSLLTPDMPYPISLSQAQREKLGIPEGQAVMFDQEIDCQNCGKRHKSQVTCWNTDGCLT
jgi:hypothetical protein